jgi:glycosyltransferase involved in cell wall biosynthesis
VCQAAEAKVIVAGSEHNAYQWPADPPLTQIAQALARLDLLFVHGPAARRQLLALGAHPTLLREGRSAIGDIDPRLPLQRGDDNRVVYAGRLHHEKGPDILLEALALLDRDVTVQLIGSGPLEAVLRERVHALGLGEQVAFLGWRRDPAFWMAGASVCVVPSRFDAWSQTAVLAMALRVPVVGTAVDGLAKVLSDGRGVAVPPESPAALAGAIRDVLDGHAPIDLDSGQRYAARFTADAVAEIYDSSYAEALRVRRARAA